MRCDVSNDLSINKLKKHISLYWSSFDGIIHCIAKSSKNELSGDYVESVTRKGFCAAHNISSYSFVALAKVFKNMLNRYSSLVTLTYIGSQKVVPNYNVMGVAKASLEANVKYMAFYMKKNFIRVNAISVPPIITLSSSGITNFRKIYKNHLDRSIKNNVVTSHDIGNVVVFLCSKLSSSITGQIIYTDNGFSEFSNCE